jgi:transposase InsO family protein
MTSAPERKHIIDLIHKTFAEGARLKRVCSEAGISLRTYRRWYKQGKVQVDQRPLAVREAPSNKLSTEECQAIVETCNRPEYASLSPSQIVPTLLDLGTYLASESSFYRILSSMNLQNHRGRSQEPKKRAKPTSFAASEPNQVWSWDITYLPSKVIGQFYYLYLFEDIFSRKIVGYEVHERECGELASKLIQRCMLSEQCFNSKNPLVLHSDNGAPMKALTMKAKLEELGVMSSYSRPRVSNDNPYSEALFRTLKYRAEWPTSGFSSLNEARDWVQNFVDWYNFKHKHSKINFVTPAERHAGKDEVILSERKKVLEAAKQKNPKRWSGSVRDCNPAGVVMLNPDKLENLVLNRTG